MMIKKTVCSTAIAVVSLAGVAIDEQVTQTNGTVLQFNGAGIRSKFMFKVYLAMLYLEAARTSQGGEGCIFASGRSEPGCGNTALSEEPIQ